MKMNLRNEIFLILFTQSCLGSGSDYYRDRVEPFLNKLKPSYSPRNFDGVMEPSVFPDLEVDQKTLLGIDSNLDGVRDDMEIFINRNFKYDYERNALKGDFKRAPYFFSNYQKMSQAELIIQESNHSEELSCLSYASGQLNLPESPEAKSYSGASSLYNTPSRKMILTYIANKCAGMTYGDGHGDKEIYPNCIKKIKDKYRPSK